MVKFTTRLSAAYNSFRWGSPAGRKALPFAWPATIEGTPQWHLIDVAAYIREGFQMNSLVYSSIMFKVRSFLLAPLKGYSGTEDDPKMLPRENELSVRLRNPNPYQTWPEFHARNTVFLNLTGNVFVWFDFRDGSIYSFNPQRIHIITNKGYPAELKGFEYVPPGNSPYDLEGNIPLTVVDTLHIKLPNPAAPLEGLGYGMSPMMPAAQSIDVDNMVSRFLKLFFQRGGMLTGILSFDTVIRKDEDITTIRERWREHYGGFDKWSVGILDRNGKYQRVGLTFEEMGFREIDYRSETRIMGPFGVAPILIAARVGLDTATYANVEAARQAYWEDTGLPELMWHQVEYSNKLDTKSNFVMFDTTKIPQLQRGLIRQVDAAHTMIEDGVPPNTAYRVAGVRVGDIPGGDKPRPPSTGRGSGQGARGNTDQLSWGQREDVPE